MSRSSQGRLTVALVLVALLAAIAIPVSANSGDNLLLGRFNTAQTDKTTVWANSPNWALRIKNVRAGAAALKLDTDPTAPPMIVNSDVRVDNLNADELDGIDALDLISLYGYDWDAQHTVDDMYLTTQYVPVATSGAFLINASASAYGSGGTSDEIWCQLEVEDFSSPGVWTAVPGTERDTTVPNTGNAVCATTGIWWPPANGFYKVRFVVYSVDTATVDQGAMWALWEPGP